MAFGKRNRLRRKKKKNLQSSTPSFAERKRSFIRRRSDQKKQAQNNKQKTNTKNYRDNSKGRLNRSKIKQKGLRTSGGEFTLDGKPYVGSYHIMSDGKVMTGRSHSILNRRRYLEPVTQPTPPPTTTPSIPASCAISGYLGLIGDIATGGSS